ncbi:hypothetical protein ACI65C_013466 [Semiaphis heraclei]
MENTTYDFIDFIRDEAECIQLKNREVYCKLLDKDGIIYEMFVGIEYLNEIGALTQDDMNKICEIDMLEANNDQDTSESEPVGANQNQSVEESIENDFIWSSKRPTSKDNEGTETFISIEISEEIQKKMVDKKTVKTKVWQTVYSKMKDAGFNVADDIKDGGNKCFQKWRNLEKSYQNHRARSLKTGNGFMKAPAHYELLHCFMESKHKVNPPSVLDTLSTNTSTISKCIPKSNVETASSVSSPVLKKSLFSDLSDNEEEEPKFLTPSILHNPKTTLKPTNKSDLIIQTINKQHSEIMMIQKDQHLDLMKVLNEQTKYRAQMAGIFETIAKGLSKGQAKKRKRDVSSSESD